MPGRTDNGSRRHLLVRLAAPAGATAIAAIALSAPAPTAAASTCPLSSMSSSSQPACWKPFTARPFNTPLPRNAELARNDDAVISHMRTYHWTIGASADGFGLGDGSRPVFFARRTDPLMRVVCKDDSGPHSCTGANGVRVGGRRIHVPRRALPAANSDAHLTVIETRTGAEYDFWDTSISGSRIYAGTAGEVNVIRGNGVGSRGDAADLALTAGLLRPSELASGRIDHALVVTVPCTNASGPNVGYTWPAAGGWGKACGDGSQESRHGAPKLGQLLRLRMSAAQIAASHAPRWQKTVMTALARYGAYVEDTNGPDNPTIDVIMQDSGSWTDLGMRNPWSRLAHRFGSSAATLSSHVSIPVQRLEVIKPCVPRGTCHTKRRARHRSRARPER